MGSIPFEEKTSQIDHHELHAALNVFLNSQTIQTESMHTPAGVFEGDIKLTEEQRTNNTLLAGNPGEGSVTIKWPNGVIPYEFDCSAGEYPKLFSNLNQICYLAITTTAVVTM